MDTPNGDVSYMSWTPTSSAKKRNYSEYIDDFTQPPSQSQVPGAYPQSPITFNEYNRERYWYSPTPSARFGNQLLSAQSQAPMQINPQLPQSLRRLMQMVANAGTAAQAVSSYTIGILAGPSERAASFLNTNAVQPVFEAVENVAKRVKLTFRPQPDPSLTPTPSTSPRRISQNLHRSPSSGRRSETAILRGTRETGLRKTRRAVRWVEEQQILSELSQDMINRQGNQPDIDMHTDQCAVTDTENLDENSVSMSAVPNSNGDFNIHTAPYRDPLTLQSNMPVQNNMPTQSSMPAQNNLPAHSNVQIQNPKSNLRDHESHAAEPQAVSDNSTDAGSDDFHISDSMCLEEEYSDVLDSITTISSSEESDSVTSSMLEGLDEEDLKDMETREEKQQRKKQERKARGSPMRKVKGLYPKPSAFSEQLRKIYERAGPTKKSVAFYNSPRSGKPITRIKEFSSEDPVHASLILNSSPSNLPTPPSSQHETSILSTSTSSDPISFASGSPQDGVASAFEALKVSSRRSSRRRSDIESNRQLKLEEEAALQAAEDEKKAAEEAQRRAIEETQLAEERTRLGVLRMPSGPVIQPLNPEWEDKVRDAMQTGLSSSRELARTSAGESLRRRDFGHVLPQDGIDPASGWLNDTIITGYLQAVVDHGKRMRDVKRNELPKVHAFATFFYENLSRRGYDSVRRWANRAKFGGKDLLKMEKIFIPINKGGNHWVLAYVNPQVKSIDYFDSFHGSAGAVFDNIKTWLRGELGDSFVDDEWTLGQNGGPVQRNVSDCGVFCVTTAKMIVLGVDPMAFSARDMPTQRRRMLAELMNGGFEGDFVPNVVF
ncbi:MAG: hypothetical protein Q9220_007370 [cf. Caloplaca sp. 1 TL-2023]